jgi:CubicO group peptidase (beta-lactamase class C family)
MTRNSRILFLLTTIIAFSLTNCKNQTINKNKTNAIFEKTDKYVEKMIDSSGIIGLNYAILMDGKLLHEKAFGLANLDLKVPMTTDKLFAVASMSKMFSSIALHKLLQENDRNVSETVGEFLPKRTDLPATWRKLTLKQLLSHTSGIPDQIEYQIYLAPDSDSFVIESMKGKPFSSQPGTEAKYNATGFLLIRIIIEKLANQDFESYMQEKYFDKLQLHKANYGGFKKVVLNRVKSYRNVNNELQLFPLNYALPMYAAAGLNINMQELIVWFQSLLKEEVLTIKQLKNIWTPVKLNNNNDGYFGQGWVARKLQDGYRMTGHGGAGISAFAHYWNEETTKNITVIVLTNGARNWTVRPEQINAEIANIMLSNE